MDRRFSLPNKMRNQLDLYILSLILLVALVVTAHILNTQVSTFAKSKSSTMQRELQNSPELGN